MTIQEQPAEQLDHIKNLMEKSSRFTSLSGYSGIAAGVIGLISAILVAMKYEGFRNGDFSFNDLSGFQFLQFEKTLIIIAAVTFVMAFLVAFYFIYNRSIKTGVSIWGGVSIRLFWSIAIPMIAGGLFLLRILELHYFELIVPVCLLFYGLALVNASKYTHGEIRFLGLGLIILGIVNLWFPGYSLYFWASGFGILHIIFGIFMWNRYERNSSVK